jgi:hypothetical protein
MNLDNKTLRDLFEIADRLGKRHYHKLTEEDFANYQEYDHWRYIVSVMNYSRKLYGHV